MSQGALAGRRILVVGASAGIGRGFARTAVAHGAQVVASARRQAVLEELCAEAGGGTPVQADIRRPEDCARLGAAAGAALGELDLVLVCAGVAPFKRFADQEFDDWRAVLETNVVGVHQLIRACLPLLGKGAILAVLSSETVGEARLGLGSYAASKAALDQSMISWRGEHPDLRFTTIAVGGTYPTEFGDAFDEGGLLGEALSDWSKKGQLPTELMPTDDVVEALVGLLATLLATPSVGMDTATLRSPTAPMAPF